MNTLPSEILKEVFWELHQTRLVDCMTVCKKWESTIKAFCLFRSVHISNKNQLEKLKNKMEKEPTLGEKVEYLFLDVVIDRPSNLDPFLRLFPYPKVIYTPTANISPLEQWHDSIESFSELNGCGITLSLLEHGIYSKLESLSVYRDAFDISGTGFIEWLVNAPALKRLRMDHFGIHIEDLELLDRTVPSICMLELDCTSLIGYLDIPNMDYIEPNTCVKSISIDIDYTEVSENVINLIEYISRKYSNLSQLKFHITQDNMQNDSDDENTLESHNNKLMSLLQRFRGQLMNLSMFLVTSPQMLFDTLDNANYRLQSLDLELLSNSKNEIFGKAKQQQYIQKLKLSGISSIAFHWLSDFNTLKELDLTFDHLPVRMGTYRRIILNKILEACPETLESISIAYARLLYEPSTLQLPFIKRLTLRDSILTTDIGTFISKALPQLRFFKLDYCQLAYKHLSLLDLHLDDLEICDIYKSGKDHLLVETLQDDKQCWYAKSARRLYESYMEQAFIKYATHPSSKRILDIPQNARPLISVACASVKNVIY